MKKCIFISTAILLTVVATAIFSASLGSAIDHESDILADRLMKSTQALAEILPEDKDEAIRLSADASTDQTELIIISFENGVWHAPGYDDDGETDIAVYTDAAENALLTGSDQAQTDKKLICAVKLDSSSVIIMTQDRIHVKSLMIGAAVPSAAITAAAIAVSLLLATWISASTVKQISTADTIHPESSGYPQELAPFISRIQKQNSQITAQMRELRIKQNEFSSIISNMQEGMLIIDHKGDILSYNSGALRLLGADGSREYKSVLSVSSSPDFRKLVFSSLGGSRSEAVLRSESSYYRILGSPVKSDDVISGAVILIFDETEKEHREQLRREFTANISHELKTPLTSISGFAELIESGMAKSDDAAYFAKKIRSEAGRLIDLVGDIIKLTQLDSGEIPYDSSTVELYEIVCQTAERLRQLAASRGITITTDGTAVFTRGNRRILEEMIYNICDNAIKYNRDSGSVKLTARNDGETATVICEDTGIGIPKELQNRVFERFFRVDKSHSREIGGTGLGLSIVKHGAAYHGASVLLESTENVGTKITLIFPATAGETVNSD